MPAPFDNPAVHRFHRRTSRPDNTGRKRFRADQQIEKALGLGGLDVLRYSGLPLLRRTDTVTHESWPWSG